MIKGLAAGSVNFALALTHGASLPGLTTLAAAAAVGFFGYGVSLTLFVLGLRHLGAARTGACFSTAPFIGAVLALPMFGEIPTPALIGAALLMGIGVYLHLAEAHEHGTCMTSITSTITRRMIQVESPIATGTGTRMFCTSIRIIRTCITVTGMSTRDGPTSLSHEGLND